MNEITQPSVIREDRSHHLIFFSRWYAKDQPLAALVNSNHPSMGSFESQKEQEKRVEILKIA